MGADAVSIAWIVWAHIGAATILTPPTAPTATATPEASHVVYTADWSHGTDGWVLPTSVPVTSGQLVFSGSGDVNLTLPYQPPVTGYTVEVGMEIDAVNTTSNGGTFTIAGQDAGGNSAYYGQVNCIGRQGPGCRGGSIAVGTEGGEYPHGLQISDFDIGPYENTCKIIVGASNVTFCYGQSCQVTGYIKVPTTALRLVLQDDYLQMVVTSVAVSIP